MRNHHRICDAQKHLLPGTNNLMEESINQETSIEEIWEAIITLQMTLKINFIDV